MNPADKNIWYALATLHETHEQDFQKKNRVLWNRWGSCRLDEAAIKTITARRRYSDEQAEGEFSPLSSMEVADVVERLRRKGFSNDEIQSISLISNARQDRFDFKNCTFSDEVNLNNYCFPLRASFDGATFEKEFVVYGAYFHSYGSFKGCTFNEQAHFGWCHFAKYGPFEDCHFKSYAHFSGTIFEDGIDFSNAYVGGHIDFDNVEFRSDAHFERVEFSDRANFYKARFQRAAFRKAKFADSADFDLSVFADDADFLVSIFHAVVVRQLNFFTGWIAMRTS